MEAEKPKSERALMYMRSATGPVYSRKLDPAAEKNLTFERQKAVKR